jgi:hypothetical protein
MRRINVATSPVASVPAPASKTEPPRGPIGAAIALRPSTAVAVVATHRDPCARPGHAGGVAASPRDGRLSGRAKIEAFDDALAAAIFDCDPSRVFTEAEADAAAEGYATLGDILARRLHRPRFAMAASTARGRKPIGRPQCDDRASLANIERALEQEGAPSLTTVAKNEVKTLGLSPLDADGGTAFEAYWKRLVKKYKASAGAKVEKCKPPSPSTG